MSGETLEHYFRHLNLDDRGRKYLENMKEGTLVDKETEEQHFKNGIGATFADCRRQIFYVYEDVVNRNPNRAPLTRWSGTS
jgi:hypothetical protein